MARRAQRSDILTWYLAREFCCVGRACSSFVGGISVRAHFASRNCVGVSAFDPGGIVWPRVHCSQPQAARR